MAELGRCKDCVHWNSTPGQSGSLDRPGICELGTSYGGGELEHFATLAAAIDTFGENEARLETSGYFGCVQFTPKTCESSDDPS